MIEAWLRLSLMMASSSPSSGSKTPPLASNAAAYKIVSSVCKNSAMRASSCLWMSWVPQMKRTELMPNPRSSKARWAAATTSGWLLSPR